MAENVDGALPNKPKSRKLWMLVAVLVVVVAGDLAFRILGYFVKPKPVGAASAAHNPSSESEKKAAAESSKPAKTEIKAIAEGTPSPRASRTPEELAKARASTPQPDDEKPILFIGGAQAIYSGDVPQNIQYVALGHLHRKQIIDNEPLN